MPRYRGALVATIAIVVAIAMFFFQKAPAPPQPPPVSDAQSRVAVPDTAPQPTAEAANPEAGRYDLTSVPQAEREELEKTLAAIEAGGPFAHKRDGIEFRNFERRLPEKQRGWYREFTVETPGADNRGARRVVRGRDGETYYSNDHYASFVRIDRGGNADAPR